MEVEASSCIDGSSGFSNAPLEQLATLDVIAKVEPTLSLGIQRDKPKAEEPAKNQENAVPVEKYEQKTVLTASNSDRRTSQSTRSGVNDIGKYRLLRTIGKGNFAKVKLAIHIATGAEVAIKIINKTVMDANLLKRLKREITLMKRTNHPNIVRLLEIIENEDVLCLVMEYASGGEIFDYLVANGKMREKEARNKFRQLVSAIQYCHAKRIVHRDLKAENILLDRDLNVKVADFGFANTFEYEQRLKTFCGSPPYAAPELFMGIPYYGPGVDVWSLGVILFALVLGHLPFDARDLHDLRKKIIGLNYTIPKGSVSTECEALLRRMLVLDPKDRASLKFFMHDKWMNLGYEDDILRPYKEPPRAHLDEVRVEAMLAMGFTREQLESSVVNPEFDHVYATYHLIPEVPSPFAALCRQLDPPQPTQQQQQPRRTSTTMTLPNALMPPPTSHVQQPASKKVTPDTAVGRFTVVPSSPTTEAAHLSTKRVVAAPVNNSVTNPADREHHSLTSALPALKRAFAQVGRTLGGQQPLETNNRPGTQTNTPRGSTKSTQKRSNDVRPALTTAPVPILATRKSNPQRVSPLPNSSMLPNQTERPCTSSGSSTGNASSKNIPSASHQASPPRTEITSKKKTTRESPSSQSPVSVGKQKPSVHSISPRVSQTSTSDKAKIKKGVTVQTSNLDAAENAIQDTKSTSSGSASDTSGEQPPVPLRKSTSLVGDLSLTDAAAAHLNTCPSAASEITHELPKHLDSGHDYPLKTNSPVSAADDPLTPIISPAASTRIAHTVQGHEAKAINEEFERLKRESSSRPSNTGTPDSSIFGTDHTHTNTWSRGVFKAIGGIFDRPHDPRLPVADGGILSGPREVRFPWSVHTTSTKTAPDVMKNILHALEVTPGCRYAFDLQLPFLVRCSWAPNRDALTVDPGPASVQQAEAQTLSSQIQDKSLPPSMLRDDPVLWEMEVCQLPRLHLRGVRLKRIRGSALQFRPIADLVMKSLHL